MYHTILICRQTYVTESQNRNEKSDQYAFLID
jgi:hypothetical protein